MKEFVYGDCVSQELYVSHHSEISVSFGESCVPSGHYPTDGPSYVAALLPLKACRLQKVAVDSMYQFAGVQQSTLFHCFSICLTDGTANTNLSYCQNSSIPSDDIDSFLNANQVTFFCKYNYQASANRQAQGLGFVLPDPLLLWERYGNETAKKQLHDRNGSPLVSFPDPINLYIPLSQCISYQ